MVAGFAAVCLLLSAQSSGIVTAHSRSPDYAQTDIATACGDYVVRIQFRNTNGQRGEVTFVSINDRNVSGAASGLRGRAANRYIERIGIMNCGFDPEDPVIMGVMELSAHASRRLGLQPSVYFRLRREGGSWRISWD